VKRAIDIADLVLKALSCLALVGGGVWAYYQFDIAGATGWQVNLAIETQVLPYHDDLRLLVVEPLETSPAHLRHRMAS